MHYGVAKKVQTCKLMKQSFLILGELGRKPRGKHFPVLLDDFGQFHKRRIRKHTLDRISIFFARLDACFPHLRRNALAPPLSFFAAKLLY